MCAASKVSYCQNVLDMVSVTQFEGISDIVTCTILGMARSTQ